MNYIFPMLVFMMVLAVFLRLDWIYYLVYVLGGTWIFSYWWIQRSLGLVDVARQVPGQAFTGETITSRLVLTNRSLLPLPWLRLQEAVANELRDIDQYRRIITLGSRGKAQIDFSLHCQKRGYYPIGPLTLRTGDLFGFNESTAQEQALRFLTVYPRVVPISALGLDSRSPFGSLRSHQRIYQDPTRMAGVRAYANGDSLRHIHWKASAHEDRLLVKKFQPAIALDVMMVLDLNLAAYPYKGAVGASEWAIVIAASVASYLAEHRQGVGLISNGMDPLSGQTTAPLPVRSGRGHLMSLLTILARIQTQTLNDEGTRTLGQWLPNRLLDVPWGTTLVVITPRVDEESLWALHSLYRRGLSVICLICSGHENIREVSSRGRRLGVQIRSTLYDDQLAGARARAGAKAGRTP